MAAYCTAEELASVYSSDEAQKLNNETSLSRRMEQVGYILNVLVAGLIDMFGFSGNLLLITCMCRQKRLTNMLIILLGLAVADMLLLALHLTFQVVPNMHLLLPVIDLASTFDPVVAFAWPVSMAVHSAGILLTVFICVERWFAVCRPLKVRSVLSLGRAKRVVIGIFVLCLLLNCPRFFEYRRCLVSDGNSTSSSSTEADENSTATASYENESNGWHSSDQYYVYQVKTSLGRSFFYTTVYSIVVYGLIIYLIPIFTLTVLTAHMLVRLERYRRFWETLSKAQQREHSITALPICIVAIVIVCETPAMVINCIDAYQIPISPAVMQFALAVSGFLVVLKCALNILAYSIYSNMLKREFKNIVKSIKPTLSSPKRSKLLDRNNSRDFSYRSNQPLSTLEVAL